MSGLLTSAPPWGLALGAPIEVEFLNRAGLAWRVLCSHWAESPDDSHPSLPQLRKLCSRLFRAVSERTLSRGLADLVKLGKVAIEPDLDHPVGRKIVPLVAVEGGDRVVTPDRTATDRTVTPYVLRESASAPYVSRGGDNSATPPYPGSGNEPLSRLLGRLESEPSAVEEVVDRFKREYGADYEPFYRQTCGQILSGSLAVGDAIGAAEYAAGPKIRKRGAAFIDQIKRRLKAAFQRKATPAAPVAPVEPSPPPAPVEPSSLPAPVEARPPEPVKTIPCPPPEDSARMARWESLPEPERDSIRAEVKAANPGLGRWGNMLEPLCLTAMDLRFPPPTPALPAVLEPIPNPKVEVLPTDRQLAMLIGLLKSSSQPAKLAAIESLRSLGRDDLLYDWEQKKLTGKPR